MPIFKNLASVVAVSVLAACGGGGGGSSSSGNALTDLINSPSTQSPAATSGTFTLTDNNGTTSTVTAALNGSGATGTTNFSSLGVTITGADSNNPTWSKLGGATRMSGKVFSYCSAGLGGNSDSVKEGNRALISTDATAVTNPNELKGLSFTSFNCSDTTQTYTFSTDGSFTVSGGGSTASLPTEALAQYMSDAGYGAFFSTSKFRVYKLTISGTTRYVIVSLLANAGSPGSKQLSVLFQN